MGVVKSCVFFFIIFVKLQHIVAQPIFESFFCDFLCDDDDSSEYDFCDGCSSSSSPSKQTKTSTTTGVPDQQINIKIPASQGTILDIVNKNGAFSVMVDAQGSSSAPMSSTTAAPTTAAAGATTAAATTAKA